MNMYIIRFLLLALFISKRKKNQNRFITLNTFTFGQQYAEHSVFSSYIVDAFEIELPRFCLIGNLFCSSVNVLLRTPSFLTQFVLYIGITYDLNCVKILRGF